MAHWETEPTPRTMLISVLHCASGCDVTTREAAIQHPDLAETARMSAPSALKTQPWGLLKPRKGHGHSWPRLALTPALFPSFTPPPKSTKLQAECGRCP